MNNGQSVAILEQAVNIAAKAGAFNIKDSSVIFTALESLKINLGLVPQSEKEEDQSSDVESGEVTSVESED
jgi:hypothetical protein